jgi:uncharacterized protein YndB with AHSA1/START domain
MVGPQRLHRDLVENGSARRWHLSLRHEGAERLADVGLFTYREIVPKEKLVFTNSFSDEKGGVTRHPGQDKWPLKMLSTFTFEDAPGGKTKFTVRWQTLDATAEEQQTFDTMHNSMTQGWGGTMDQLADYLSKAA